MARICQLCDKSPKSGNTRSHSNKANKRAFRPNIIAKNIDLWEWIKIKVKICASCYKKLVAEWKI